AGAVLRVDGVGDVEDQLVELARDVEDVDIARFLDAAELAAGQKLRDLAAAATDAGGRDPERAVSVKVDAQAACLAAFDQRRARSACAQIVEQRFDGLELSVFLRSRGRRAARRKLATLEVDVGRPPQAGRAYRASRRGA